MTTSINTILKNRKNRKNKKGFSLVELIVVLVIMAILAAALVPTLIGYIKQSRQSNIKNEAAACVQAAQTIASSAYADSNSTYTGVGTKQQIKITIAADGAITIDDTTKFGNEVLYLADLSTLNDKKAGTVAVSNVTIDKNLVVTGLTYKHDDTTVIYSNGNYTVS